MADNLPKRMYPIGDENGAIMAPPSAARFEDLSNLVNHVLLTVDDDKTKPQAPNKKHNIPRVPADKVCESGSENEYATHVCANSTKTA
jgi:hypothetical protein